VTQLDDLDDLDVDEMETCEGCCALLHPERCLHDIEGVALCDECAAALPHVDVR